MSKMIGNLFNAVQVLFGMNKNPQVPSMPSGGMIAAPLIPPPAPPPPPAPVTAEMPPQQAAQQKATQEALDQVTQEERMKRRRGRQSTLLTGPSGLSDEGLSVSRKTLLG